MGSTTSAMPSSDTAALQTSLATPPKSDSPEWLALVLSAIPFLILSFLFLSEERTPPVQKQFAPWLNNLNGSSIDLNSTESEMEKLKKIKELLEKEISELETKAPTLQSYFILAIVTNSHNRSLISESTLNGIHSEPVQQIMMAANFRVNYLPIMEMAKKRFPEFEQEVHAFQAALDRMYSERSYGGRDDFIRRTEHKNLSSAIVNWLTGNKAQAMDVYSTCSSSGDSVIAILDDEQATQDRGWSAGEVHVLKAIRAALDQSALLEGDAKSK